MRRLGRVVVPLLFAAAVFIAYWFARKNPDVIDQLDLDRKATLRVLLFLTWFPLIFFIIRAVDVVAFDVLASRKRNVRAPVLLREIVSIALFLLLLAWTISSIFDYRVTAFLATGTVLAAVLGLALQETLGNLFAGIALHLDDSFELGDVIRSGDTMGIVEGVRWRGTHIRTFNNNVIIVPNSMLARERLEVFPRSNPNARILQFGIDYNVAPASVIGVLTQAASNVDGVEKGMPCFARVAGFAESAVVYEIKYFTADYSLRDRIDADIRKAVWYALKRNAIPIPYPIRAMQRYQAPQPRHHPDHDEIVERLGRVDILSPLSAEARDAIADAARIHVFSKGETIIRHGTSGDSMFIVHEGTVSVRVSGGEVAQLEAGAFFGEMALLTGEMRAADIVALTDVITVEIAKDALNPVLHDHPELAAMFSAKVMERRGTLDSLRESGKEEESTILSRIRAYFGL